MISRIARTGTELVLFFLIFTAASLSPEKAFQKGLELREAGRFEEAESQFKRALEENPSNADYHFELANLYGIEHDMAMNKKEEERAWRFLESAARELEQVLMIRQEFMAARFNLGVVYKRLGKYEQARSHFKQVLQQNPQAFEAMLQIGQTYEEQGFFDEAESIYEDARDRGLPPADVSFALQNLQQKRFMAARDSQGQMNQSLGMMQQKLASAYAENRSNPNSIYNGNSSGSAGNFNTSSALNSLAPLLMQQFMKSREQKNDQNNF